MSALCASAFKAFLTNGAKRRSVLLLPQCLLGSQRPQLVSQSSPMEQLNKESAPLDNILNNKAHENGPIDVLKRAFKPIGAGTFDLYKDESSGVAMLTIDHPERKNAFSGAMMAEFGDVIGELESWEKGKAVIIHGKGGFFCSGGDLTTVEHIKSNEGGRQMGIVMQESLTRLQNLPMLTLAVIEGKAIGGGAEITTACDFRLMTPSAEIGFVHVKIAITAGWGGGSRLVQLLGPSKALQLMTSGVRLSATEALKCGFINGILDNCIESDPDDVLVKARQWLDPHIEADTAALRACKEIVNAAKWLPLQEALRRELDFFSKVWGGPAHKKALLRNVKHK